MAIDTFSVFYYGHNIDRNNRFLNIDEGGGEISVEIAVGSYTLSEFAAAVQSSLNSAGSNEYTVTVDRTSRRLTVAADAAFDLLVSSGSQLGQSAWSLLGFSGADRTGLLSYEGNLASGFEYRPQFKLQDYVDSEINSQGISTVINKTSEGAIEVVSFGREQFFEMNIRYITNLPQDGKVIRNNPNGVLDAVSFMEDATRKRRMEFMKDVDDRNTFAKVILESTPDSREGIGYKLRERISDSLRDYYDTGLLTFRVVS